MWRLKGNLESDHVGLTGIELRTLGLGKRHLSLISCLTSATRGTEVINHSLQSAQWTKLLVVTGNKGKPNHSQQGLPPHTVP